MESGTFRDSLSFDSKIVVITGSGTGIGQAIAKLFVEKGATIIIMGRRKEPLEQTSKILNQIIDERGLSSKVREFPGVDVADEKGVNEMFKVIKEEFGKIDIVINNAGISGPVKSFTNANFEEFKDCVAIHLTGTFWTSIRSLEILKSGGKIVTISTFFTEENRFEQRPYRFRTPYTAAQGAKNRLSEAIAWELAAKGIRSICINPGPVHSDRIYKTVYPKAAAEFLRIGGYQGLTSKQIEIAAAKLLPLLGEDQQLITNAINEIAREIAGFHNSTTRSQDENYRKIASDMLLTIQEIAEKIQNNTSKMIIDGEFLTQEEVATMVTNICDDKISRLINGRIIPNDRLFYPVKPFVATSPFEKYDPSNNIKGKVVVIVLNTSSDRDLDRINEISKAINTLNGKLVVVLTSNQANVTKLEDQKIQFVNLADESNVREILRRIKADFGRLDAVIYLTGDYDYNISLQSLSRKAWDELVDNFVNIPSLITKESVNAMAPAGSIEEPSKFKGSEGIVMIIGPEAPTGKKISGLIRARSEIFRGALRPYTATVNQELRDVLGSSIRLYLLLPGNIDGYTPKPEHLSNSILQLISGSNMERNESIFYLDENQN